MVEGNSGFDTHGSAQTSLHYSISYINTPSSYSSLQQEKNRCDEKEKERKIFYCIN